MKDQRRGKNIALAGAAIQAVLAVLLLAIGAESYTNALSAQSSWWFLAGGVLVWLMVALLFYCRQLQLQEAEELAALSARGEQGGGIFDRERDLSLRPAASRLAFVEKWIVPGFTLSLAGYQVALGVVVIRQLQAMFGAGAIPPIASYEQGALFTVLGAFPAFLFSRYCTGMAGNPQYRPLRAAAAYMLAGTAAGLGVIAAFVGAWWGYRVVDEVVAFAVPIVQFVLAAELLVGFLIDIYRPRVPGQEHRLSFDSRALSLLAEPGRIGHSIAETLNYQFGFEVSQTWLYRLLSKTALPLAMFAAGVLVAMTSIVIVHQGEQCVVLHWGRAEPGALLGPGMHLKWPWPIDTARLFDVGEIRELRVGLGGEQEPTIVKGQELQLWTAAHGRFKELDFLLAVPPRGQRQGRAAASQPAAPAMAPTTGPATGNIKTEMAPPVSIIKLVLSVRYRVDDAYKFGYRFTDAEELLEGEAYRQMVRYCASATLNTEIAGADPNRPQAIMTSGWEKASAALEQRIRKAVGPEGLDLGVQITSARLIAVHPPAEAAGAFEAVLAAERKQDQLRYQAEGEANRALSGVAGDPGSALALSLAIGELEQWESLASLRTRPAEFDARLRDYARKAAVDLDKLLAEIRREVLLGKIARDAAPKGEVDYAAALGKYMPHSDKPLNDLLTTLRQDEALGLLARKAGTFTQQLARRYMEHLLALLAARGHEADYDLAARIAAARQRADGLFALASGEPARKVAEATAEALTNEMKERSLGESFQRELHAYQASPNIYRFDRYLDVWDSVLPGMTKYILGVPRDRVELWLNWEQSKGAMLEGAYQGTEPITPGGAK